MKSKYYTHHHIILPVEVILYQVLNASHYSLVKTTIHFVIMTCWIWFLWRNKWNICLRCSNYNAFCSEVGSNISHLYLSKLLLEFFSLFFVRKKVCVCDCLKSQLSSGLFSAALLLIVAIHCIIKECLCSDSCTYSSRSVKWNYMSFQTFGMIHNTSLESLQYLEYCLKIRPHKTASVPAFGNECNVVQLEHLSQKWKKKQKNKNKTKFSKARQIRVFFFFFCVIYFIATWCRND